MRILLASALLPLLVSAAPAAEPDEGSGLEKRKSAQSCKIINVNPGSYVNCRYWPHLKSSAMIGLEGGDKYTFECYTEGDCYEGNCTWDKLNIYNDWCFVNGAFTSSNCGHKKLPKCKMPKRSIDEKRDSHALAPIEERDSHMPAPIDERENHAPAPIDERDSHIPAPVDAEG